LHGYIGRAAVKKMLPHAGDMCLIESVTRWEETSIECLGACNSIDHPLLRNGQLPATAAIEYAAQATAVHGFLLNNGGVVQFGVLAKLTDIALSATVIDPVHSPLQIYAELIARTDAACIYNFEVKGARLSIASGRLMIAFLVRAEE
jgi:predicted hotdog family 3-hydroxylacyl-ACP dehydratase